MHRKSTSHAYIGLGSNLGDRAGNLVLAIRGVMDAGLPVSRLSSVYETAPCGTFSQPDFLNMVAAVSADALPQPEQLLARLLKVEYALGRTREVPMGPRTIDLDLLLFDDAIVDSDFLTLPHPRMHQRAFVLTPLAQLAPDVRHPLLGKSIAELLRGLEDKSGVRLWKPSR